MAIDPKMTFLKDKVSSVKPAVMPNMSPAPNRSMVKPSVMPNLSPTLNKPLVKPAVMPSQKVPSLGYGIKPAVMPKAPIIAKPQMITGYKNGIATQVERNKYNPGVSLYKPTSLKGIEEKKKQVLGSVIKNAQASSTAPTTPTAPVVVPEKPKPTITGYKNGIATQVPKGEHVEGVSLYKPTSKIGIQEKNRERAEINKKPGKVIRDNAFAPEGWGVDENNHPIKRPNPTGSELLSGPSKLKGLRESQLFRDPSSRDMYKKKSVIKNVIKNSKKK